MLDQTFKSLRTQFFMVARRWMETEEEKRMVHQPRASPSRPPPLTPKELAEQRDANGETQMERIARQIQEEEAERARTRKTRLS
jgi:hypothetical protein